MEVSVNAIPHVQGTVVCVSKDMLLMESEVMVVPDVVLCETSQDTSYLTLA